VIHEDFLKVSSCFSFQEKSLNSRLRGNFFLLRKSASCRTEISPNVNPALKNFSARRFAPEDKFLEGLPLLLIAMLSEIATGSPLEEFI
jgi:hypothetical protein